MKRREMMSVFHTRDRFICSVMGGMAEFSYFIQRLIATNVHLEVYNASNADSWLYITGADRVAELVVGLLLYIDGGDLLKVG